MRLNINTDALVVFTNKLEKLHKSAFPSAVRNALNSTAFDVKKNTLQKEASKQFINRAPTFFKAFSKVQMAQGFNVNTMAATVGMVSQGLKGGNNYAVKDLEQQEDGGKISGRSFIPLPPARGGSEARPVRPANRLSAIKRIINARNSKGKNEKEKFIRAAVTAGSGGYVLGNTKPVILWRINSIKYLKSKRKTVINKTPLYTYDDGRSVRVDATKFFKRSSLESAKKMEKYYIEAATFQFEKYK